MRRPLRENLEVRELNGEKRICCSQCEFQYCSIGEDWRKSCKVQLLPPSKAGRLMTLLDGQYSMRQFCCPSCGALVDTDFVEEKKNEVGTRERAEAWPYRPEPVGVKLESKTTAIVVLDLSARCEDPQEVCSALMAPLSEFLSKARQADVPIIFTISAAAKGGPLGEAAVPLGRLRTEPVFYPDAFDKFMGGELKAELDRSNCRSLVIVGSATNFAVLYTATTAARIHRYEVVIPLDGVNAKGQYEHEYAIHQLSILPASANKQFRFTMLNMVEFN